MVLPSLNSQGTELQDAMSLNCDNAKPRGTELKKREKETRCSK
jgi:hypothetical protein